MRPTSVRNNSIRSLSAWSLALAASSLLIAGCGDSDNDPSPPAEDNGSGNMTLQAWGEDYVDVGIPAEDFIDGWALTFTNVLVAVSDVKLDGHGNPSLLTAPRIVDLAAFPAGAKTLETTEVPAGLYSTVQYRVAPVAADYDTAGLSDEAVAMVESGSSIVLVGSAIKGIDTIDFNWSFDTDTRYEQCQIDTTVEKDGEESVELTFHFDHIFNDDLDSPTPNVAFDLIASADADEDGIVTKEELQAVDIQGEERYQVGSRPITNLWDYIVHQSTTIGHINGEGHCGE